MLKTPQIHNSSLVYEFFIKKGKFRQKAVPLGKTQSALTSSERMVATYAGMTTLLLFLFIMLFLQIIIYRQKESYSIEIK